MSWTSLENAFAIIRNGASIKQDDNCLGVPITRIETISNRNIDTSKLGYANVQDDQYSDFYLQEGDILMSHINSLTHLGKTALVGSIEDKIIHGMNLLLLRTKKEILYPNFANYYFGSPKFIKDLIKISNQSVNQCSFSISKLKELQIPLPPLPIQKRIAEILDAADALKRKDQELLKKYDELAQAIFIDMFGDPVKNEKGWKIGKIKDLAKEVKYGTSKPAEQNGTIPYLRMNNITYSGEWDFSKLKYIDLAGNELEKYVLSFGDLVFNRTNSKELVGKTAVFDSTEKMIIAGYLIRLRTNEFGNPYYISSYLNSIHGKKTLLGMCKSIVGMANINAQELQQIKILIPPINLQIQFEGILREIKSIRMKTQKQMLKSESLFNSLIQKAFKGELVA